MRKLVASICCLIVGLQVLIGVPLIVCIAFLLFVNSDFIDRATIEFRIGEEVADAPAAPEETASTPAPRDPNEFPDIMASRHDRGSLLAGTSLAASSAPAADENDFVAALKRIAADAHSSPAPYASASTIPPSVAEVPSTSSAEGDWTENDESLLINVAQRYCRNLYSLADRSEEAGDYAQADDLRRRARALRSEISFLGKSAEPAPPSPIAPSEGVSESPSACPATASPSAAAPETRLEAKNPILEQPRVN